MRLLLKRLFLLSSLTFLTLSVGVRIVATTEARTLYPFIGKLTPSPDGRYILFEGDFSGLLQSTQFYILDIFTKQVYQLADPNIQGYDPAWAPDGSAIAFTKETEDTCVDIYLVNPDGTNLRRLTHEGAHDPIWSPDGNYLAISVHREGDFESLDDILIIDRGGKDVAWLITSPDDEWPVAWSPDGSYILFIRHEEGKYLALWRADIDLSKPFPAEHPGIYRLTEPGVSVWSVAISPDGSKIVATFVEKAGLWVMNSDGSESIMIIQPENIGPGEVAWCPQVNKIAFVGMEGQEYNEVEGWLGPYNIYLINPDGTGLEQLTFFTGVPCSQAKSLHFPLFAQAKQRSGMREKMMVHKETKKVARGEAKEVEKQSFKIALRTAGNSKGLSINEGSSESKRAPIFAGALSLSALGYALWKLLKILG